MSRKNSTTGSQTTSPPVDPRAVGSREKFAEFLRNMARDFREHPDNWENADLGTFLGAMAAWIDDMDGYYAANGGSVPDQPTWKTLAEIVAAARVYE